MDEAHLQTLKTFEQLQVGDEVELKHEVKVGFRAWETVTTGKVVRVERRRHGLHRRRNHDDRVFSDVIVLQRPDGELTTVTLDEFSVLKKL
ncbi:MAG: hypothetical protein AAF497_29650 [Planctomycetota bacterium]